MPSAANLTSVGQFHINIFIKWPAKRADKMNQVPRCDQLLERARWSDTACSQNIFRDIKKIFCDFSDGMELENQKTETRPHFCIYNWLPFQCPKIN